MKQCNRCKAVKEDSLFGKRKLKVGYGLSSECKDCKADRQRERNKLFPEKHRERVYKWRRENRQRYLELHKEEAKEYRRSNRNKENARAQVNYWVKKGTLKKSPCADCGASLDVEAHHHDYSKPLEIVWLCPRCHSRRHVLAKA